MIFAVNFFRQLLRRQKRVPLLVGTDMRGREARLFVHPLSPRNDVVSLLSVGGSHDHPCAVSYELDEAALLNLIQSLSLLWQERFGECGDESEEGTLSDPRTPHALHAVMRQLGAHAPHLA